MIVEIVNPMGEVSYTRLHNHPDVTKALHTAGYEVRIPHCEASELFRAMGCFRGLAYPVTLTHEGLVIDAVTAM